MRVIISDGSLISMFPQMSELSQFDDGNVLTHGSGMANRKKRGRRPLDYPDEKNKVSALIYKHRCLDSDKNFRFEPL